MAGAMELEWETYPIGRRGSSLHITGLENLRELKGRYVYVIETPRAAAIQYPKGISNICYIGRSQREGGRRAYAHARGWIGRHLVLSQTVEPFQIHICHPRRRNLADAYKDVEAVLLGEFSEKFGSFPLFNKRQETDFGRYDICSDLSFLRRRNRPPAIVAGAVDPEVAADDIDR